MREHKIPFETFKAIVNQQNIKNIEDFKKFEIDKLQGYQNVGQEDQRNYLSVRVFSNKFKDDILHHTLEEEARAG